MKAEIRITTPDGDISLSSKDTKAGTPIMALEQSLDAIYEYVGDKSYIVTGEFSWDGTSDSIVVDFLVTNDHVE